MKPSILNKKLFNLWVNEANDYLVDRPLTGMLTNSLLSSYNSNFRETPDGYKLEVAVPGMSKKDLKLEVNNYILTIRGHKQQKNKWGWFNKAVEFRSTELYKTYVMPEDADTDDIQTKCKDGILKVSIPKITKKNKRKLIPVTIDGHPEADWWEKLAQPIKSLWDKVSGKTKRLVPGF